MRDAIEKLRKSGYTVRQLPHWILPQSYFTQDLKGKRFFEISIADHKVWNQQDRYGWFTDGELSDFAAKVPAVKQASFMESGPA